MSPQSADKVFLSLSVEGWGGPCKTLDLRPSGGILSPNQEQLLWFWASMSGSHCTPSQLFHRNLVNRLESLRGPNLLVEISLEDFCRGWILLLIRLFTFSSVPLLILSIKPPNRALRLSSFKTQSSLIDFAGNVPLKFFSASCLHCRIKSIFRGCLLFLSNKLYQASSTPFKAESKSLHKAVGDCESSDIVSNRPPKKHIRSSTSLKIEGFQSEAFTVPTSMISLSRLCRNEVLCSM